MAQTLYEQPAIVSSPQPSNLIEVVPETDSWPLRKSVVSDCQFFFCGRSSNAIAFAYFSSCLVAPTLFFDEQGMQIYSRHRLQRMVTLHQSLLGEAWTVRLVEYGIERHFFWSAARPVWSHWRLSNC